MKTLIIRADGNARIGAGHLMRCLTIADAVKKRKCVEFVCADEESAALVRERGYTVQVLSTDFRDLEKELLMWEKLTFDDAAADNSTPGTRIILVDSYYVTNAYLTALKKYGSVILLDDMAKAVWNADAVINYNAFADEEMYEALKSPYATKVYAGGKYIPIRKEFCSRQYVVRDRAEHILITTGGGDIENIAGQILEKIWSEDCHYHVVTGRFNPHYDELAAFRQKCSNIHIYHDVKDMAGLMEQCDLAVTAGGTTIYELSAIGVPFVCFSYAENQEKLTEYIGRNQIAGYGGAFHKASEQTLELIGGQVEELMKNAALRLAYSEKEQELVDGKGAGRIAEIICRDI